MSGEHLQLLRQGAKVWNCWREQHPSVRPDLSKADLREVRLVSADLSETILTGADLRNAYLYGAELRRADLRQADLRGAILVTANLSQVCLDRADLRGADLRGAKGLTRQQCKNALLGRRTKLPQAIRSPIDRLTLRSRIGAYLTCVLVLLGLVIFVTRNDTSRGNSSSERGQASILSSAALEVRPTPTSPLASGEVREWVEGPAFHSGSGTGPDRGIGSHSVSPASPSIQPSNLKEKSVDLTDSSTHLHSSARLTELNVLEEDELVRIFARTGNPPRFRTFRLDDPKRLVIDVLDVILKIPRSQRARNVEHSELKLLRVEQNALHPPVVRLVLEVSAFPPFEVRSRSDGLDVQVRSGTQ